MSPPTRQEIIEKMNYRMTPPDWYATAFAVGLRCVLGKALTLPRDTDYDQHFNESKVFDLRRYFRGYGSEEERIRKEALYPECLREVTDDEADARWGQLAGKHAAIRWLTDEDREAAEDFFPFTDL